MLTNPSMPTHKSFLAVLVVALFSASCSKKAPASATKMPPPQVVVAEARSQRVEESLSQIANIQANEAVDIKAETDGIVREIFFIEGQKVKKGDLLVRLDETKFVATLAQTEANFKLAQASFERSKQLLKDQLIPQQDFDQAAASFHASQANLEFSRRAVQDAQVQAPFDGVMGARQISPGQLITKNTVVSWLIDLDPVKVEFNVPEKFLGQVKEKQQISVRVEAYPKEKFTGQVFFISPFVDSTNRTALVKAQIPNPSLQLKPGMFANLDLTLTVRENAIVIPEMAITQTLTNSQALIFAVDQNGTAQMKKIRTGVRLVGAVEVLEGLNAGEKVIVEGLQKVIPGAPVRIASPEGAKPAALVGQKET